ncbi:hypothetical protein G4B88_025118, partial [Cannabis sativa]
DLVLQKPEDGEERGCCGGNEEDGENHEGFSEGPESACAEEPVRVEEIPVAPVEEKEDVKAEESIITQEKSSPAVEKNPVPVVQKDSDHKSELKLEPNGLRKWLLRQLPWLRSAGTDRISERSTLAGVVAACDASIVLDVSPHEFVKAYAAHLKRSGKVCTLPQYLIMSTMFFMLKRNLLVCAPIEYGTLDQMVASMNEAKAERANLVELPISFSSNISQLEKLIKQRTLPAILSFSFKSAIVDLQEAIHKKSILWRGTNAGLALAVPTVGIYLPCYDIFRNWLEVLSTQNAPIMTPYVPLVAGSLARSLACATCYPIELARTRMQVNLILMPMLWLLFILVYTKPEPYAILIVYFSAYTLISFFKKRENPSNSIFLSCFRVLKIDRSEPSDLNLSEDPVVYSSQEIKNLLQRIAEGNRATGGLNFVTKVYGIAGCIKFLESYYLILVTKRRQIGCVCGHAIYSIDESQLVPIPHVSIQTDVSHSKTEL